MTKELKTALVISRETAKALGDEFRVRELREVHVKGRAEAVRSFTVEPSAPPEH